MLRIYFMNEGAMIVDWVRDGILPPVPKAYAIDAIRQDDPLAALEDYYRRYFVKKAADEAAFVLNSIRNREAKDFKIHVVWEE